MTQLPSDQMTLKTAPSPDSALVVEGGAMRGVFATGVLDGFLEGGFNPFDLLIGVSSGSTNLAAYLAKMPKRNYKIYTDYCLRPEFLSIKRFISGGHLMDLDWLWDITIAEIRLDLKTIFSQAKKFLIGLTDVRTGQAIFKATTAENLEDVLKASSAMPLIYRNFPVIDGKPTVDGGIADPLPIDKVIQMGARNIMVIRSRTKNYVKKEALSNRYLLWKLRSYPALQKAVADRVKRYNDAVALIRTPPSGVSVFEICPPDNFRPARFGKNKKDLDQGYEQGRSMAKHAMQTYDGWKN